MKSFRQYILEAGGQAAGKLEIGNTSVEKAREYAEKLFRSNKKELDEHIPSFDENYRIAQRNASQGWTRRKDMPVITDDDVRNFQARLKKGMIDVNPPFADETDEKNPFKGGLSNKEAEIFLSAGFKDGVKNDDPVKVSSKRVSVKQLKPIQKQIYFDKSIAGIAQFGAEGSRKFMTSTNFITSSDLYIIDGHHRYLGSMLLDPNLKVKCLVIDLPINKLLPLSLAYGDAIGNKRNA